MSLIMTRAGLRAIELINEQIEAAKDRNGQSYSYSTKPFARPMGGLKGVNIKRSIKQGDFSPFTTKAGARWIIVPGGYKRLRELQGLSSTSDYLQSTGQMLRDMTILESGQSQVRIGFRTRRSARLAFWLNVSGAGKSRKLWRFFGLTAGNRRKLAQTMGVVEIAKTVVQGNTIGLR